MESQDDVLDEITVGTQDVVNYLRVNGDFAPALRDVVERKMCAQAARESGMDVTDEELQEVFDNFRYSMGLEEADDTKRWLEASGLSLDDLEEHLEENLLMYKWKNHLEEQANKDDYLESETIQDQVREMIYQDWVNEQLE